jgi:hypothetical protein
VLLKFITASQLMRYIGRGIVIGQTVNDSGNVAARGKIFNDRRKVGRGILQDYKKKKQIVQKSLKKTDNNQNEQTGEGM